MKYEVEITRISYVTQHSLSELRRAARRRPKKRLWTRPTTRPLMRTPLTTRMTAAPSLNLPTKNGRMSMERNMNIIESWWRHNGIWDREQASGILVENYDGETEIYLASTDDWWDSLSDKQKQDVYEDFFNET